MIYVPKMTLLEKSKICRTFRAVGHLGTLQTLPVTAVRFFTLTSNLHKSTSFFDVTAVKKTTSLHDVDT